MSILCEISYFSSSHPIPRCCTFRISSIQFRNSVLNQPTRLIRQWSSSMQFPPIPFNSVQFPPIPFNSVQFRPIPFNSVQFPPIPSNSIQFRLALTLMLPCVVNRNSLEQASDSGTEFRELDRSGIRRNSVRFRSIPLRPNSRNSVQESLACSRELWLTTQGNMRVRARRNRTELDAIERNRTELDAIERNRMELDAIERNRTESDAIERNRTQLNGIGRNWTEFRLIPGIPFRNR
jgi:hypothetical protein